MHVYQYKAGGIGMEMFRWAGWRDEAKESGGKRDGQSLCWTLFKRFESCTVKLIKETIWTSLEVRTRPTFLESLISKYDFGPL